jgi:3'(2'), 5'-bisphosphate nucleotidase
MRQINLAVLLEELPLVARLAGDAIMAVYGVGRTVVQCKEDLSPVTQADLAAHQVLVSHLGKLLPDCPVVSEEDAASQTHRCGSKRFWLIDPLDGTKEFIACNGEFTVNISLIEEGRSVLGVVYAPAVDAMYRGGPGIGAWCSIGGQTNSIRVGEAGGICRVVASKSHFNAETQAFIDRLGPVSLVQAGSSLKFCRVAEGQADIYPRLAPTCEWDTAAAQAILEGAGGAVLDLQGQPLRYGKFNILNPSFIATSGTAMAFLRNKS